MTGADSAERGAARAHAHAHAHAHTPNAPRHPSVVSSRAPSTASAGKHTGSELWDDHHAHPAVVRTSSTLGMPDGGHSHWLAGVGHIICANIGAGVLSLPHAVAWLGWVGGPLMIVFCTGVAMFCAELLTNAYRAKGERCATYKDAVMAQLGPRQASFIVGILYLKYFLVTVGYTVVAATGMLYIGNWACVTQGITPGPWAQLWVMVLIFSGLQLFMSQLPNLESVAGASAIGALMSLLYTGIALVLCFANVSNRRGSFQGRPAPAHEKLFGIFNAFGSILFSNASAVLTIDIQHTLKEPPPNNITMRKVVRTAFGIAMALYATTGITGYIAVGDDVGSDILVEFEESPAIHRAVPLVANVFTVIHFIPAYQVFAQPLFVVLEQTILRIRPGLALGPEWPVRLVYRSIYVCITAVLAATLPFFGAISGLIGAIAFWPTVVAGPIFMYLSMHQPPKPRAVALCVLLWVMFAISACALVGSVFGFVKSASSFKPFGGGGSPH